VLELPVGVLATILADLGAPLLVLADFDPHEGIHLVHGATTVNIKVSAVDRETHEALSRNDEATTHHRLLVNDSDGLDHGLLVHNSDGLNHGLLVHNSDGSTRATAHTDELGSHADPTTSVELDNLLAWTVAGEDIKGHVGLANSLHGVALILDDDVHVVLEHVGGNLHELQGPSGLLAAVVAGCSVEDLVADLNVNEGGHFVQGATNFVVKLGSEDVEFEETHRKV
jgi:hypothetical protein